MSDHSVEGRCLCQAVRFAYDGEPNWTAHCHCESCRRATSSPMTTWISVPRNTFRLTAGKPAYFNSSSTARRGFCPDCGSPLTYENTALPDEVHIYAVALSDPAAVMPDRHVFVEEQLPWFETADHLPRYHTTSQGGAKPVRTTPRPASRAPDAG